MRTLKIHTLPSVKEAPWLDKDYILFHANFQIFCNCVEEENLFDQWLCEEYSETMNILKNLYNWWQENKNKEDFDSLEDEAQEKLELLIKNRRYLWT